MSRLQIVTNYISKKESITKIDKLVQDKISIQVKGDIFVIVGDTLCMNQ